MYLGPHQFQAQNAYIQNLADFTASSLWFAPYGFATRRLDQDKVKNGVLAIQEASGFLEDGTAFELPIFGETLAADFRGDFAAAAPSLTGYLALPLALPNAQNVRKAGDGGTLSRFVETQQTVLDETTGADEKPVPMGKLDFRLMFGEELPDSERYVSLPVARMIRDGAGRYSFDERFIPPCVQMSASNRLILMVERLIGRMGQISASLMRAETRQFRAGLSEQDVTSFWFAHSLNSALAPLRHLSESRRCHPERLYSELLRLGGALCTFIMRTRPGELPLYDHDNPERCFDALERHILDHLNLREPDNCVSIPLVRRDENFYRGSVTDQRCLGPSRWVVGIRAAVGEADLIEATPRLVKICSNNFIEKLARRAVKGSLALMHLPVPPPALRPKPTAQYYSISRSGPCWEDIMKTKEVGLYVPSNFPEPQLELLVILES